MDLLREILPSAGLVLLAHLVDGLRTVLRWLENPGGSCQRFAGIDSVSVRPAADARRREQQLRSGPAFPA